MRRELKTIVQRSAVPVSAGLGVGVGLDPLGACLVAISQKSITHEFCGVE